VGQARRLPLFVTALCLLASAGCGANVDPRRPMHGEVTVDSLRVERGSISFLPTGETVGPAATTAIAGGRYEFTRSNGPYTGTYRVKVGIIALQTSEIEPPVAIPAEGGAASAKAGLIQTRRSNSSSDLGSQEKSRQWDAECVIDAQGSDRQNFDFTTESL
jgi:hypothetical protein